MDRGTPPSATSGSGPESGGATARAVGAVGVFGESTNDLDADALAALEDLLDGLMGALVVGDYRTGAWWSCRMRRAGQA